MQESFPFCDKEITIYGPKEKGLPLVIINEEDPLDELYTKLSQDHSFNLLKIGKSNWLDDMSPWPSKALFKGDGDCRGLALEHLNKIEKLMPYINESLDPRAIFIGGYSLGGLFALYAAINSDLFDGVIAASGSFWYPDFIDYTTQRKISTKVKYIYFSLGDKEAKVKNKTLQKVEDNTRFLADYYKTQGITTTFVLNKGDHFTESKDRLAKGIAWILEKASYLA